MKILLRSIVVLAFSVFLGFTIFRFSWPLEQRGIKTPGVLLTYLLARPDGSSPFDNPLGAELLVDVLSALVVMLALYWLYRRLRGRNATSYED